MILNSSPCEPCTVKIGCAEPEPMMVRRLVPLPEMRAVEAVTAATILTDPLIPRDPVTVCVSVIALPILTPVFVTWNSIALPVNTVREPDITTA